MTHAQTHMAQACHRKCWSRAPRFVWERLSGLSQSLALFPLSALFRLERIFFLNSLNFFLSCSLFYFPIRHHLSSCPPSALVHLVDTISFSSFKFQTSASPSFIFNWSINAENVVLISLVQCSESAIRIHISRPSGTSLPPTPIPPLQVLTEHPSRVPCAIEQLPTSYPFHTWQSTYVNATFSVPPILPFPCCVHMVSTSVSLILP